MTYKTVLNTIQFVYDSEGRMTQKIFIPSDGIAQTVSYETSKDNDTVVKFSAGGRNVISHSKADSFGRKVFDELQLGKDFVSRQFVYHAGEVTQTHKDNVKVKSSATTQLVSQIILSGGRTLSYEYDAEERITKVTDSIDGTTEYTYDALGQLLTETVTKDGVTTVVNSMEYDNYGNITKKNGKVYTYDTTWKDLLTCYDGQSIPYDDQGNPTSYLGYSLTWEKGRQLKTLVKGTGDSRKTYTFTYNANGIRTSKALREGDTLSDTRVHKYTLNGEEILRETVYDPNMGGDSILYELYPLRDNEGEVCGIIHRVFEYTEAGKIYQEIPYYFQKNLQGDVIAIVNKDAEIVARYSYDAWGKILSITDKDGNTISPLSAHIAYINPFRYRSYYYDEETSLYYLRSRFYDAHTGRFINGDAPDYLGYTGTICGYNLFAYSENDVVNKNDTLGYSWLSDKWEEAKKFCKKAKKTVQAAIEKTVSALENIGSKAEKAIVSVTQKITTKIENTVQNAKAVVNGWCSNTLQKNKKTAFDVHQYENNARTKAMNFCVDVWAFACEEVFSGKFFRETVQKKWIKEGFWEKFCKGWVYETVILGAKDKVNQTIDKIKNKIKNLSLTKIATFYLKIRDDHALLKIPLTRSLKNLKNNRDEWNNYLKTSTPSYITDQHAAPFPNMHLGYQTLDECGCEVIAIYNVLYKFGLTLDLPDLIFIAERLGAVMLGGFFGTNAYAINEILEYLGVSYKTFNSVEDIENSKADKNIYIISSWNKVGSPFGGYHTYMVTCNTDPSDSTGKTYKLDTKNACVGKPTFSEMLKNDDAEFICGYLIKN